MKSTIDNQALSAYLVTLNLILFVIYLNYGFVTENDGIRNLYLTVVFVFIACVVCCIYYRQNYKTTFFWLTAFVTLVFIIASLFYMYLYALSKADWR